MISKKLLSKILGEEVEELTPCYGKHYYAFTYKNDERKDREISIYELAHKCKVWAIKKGWFITIRYVEQSNIKVEISKDLHTVFGVTSFNGSYELDVIVKACEWILESIKDSDVDT